MSNYPLNWDLDLFFQGGSESKELRNRLNEIAQNLFNLVQRTSKLQDKDPIKDWVEVCLSTEEIGQWMEQITSYVTCLTSQNVQDEKAVLLESDITNYHAQYNTQLSTLEGVLKDLPKEKWQELISDERLQPIAFFLTERRKLAAVKLPTEMENLAADLAVDGYHAWSLMYDQVVGNIRVPVQGEQLSVGQAHNRMATANRPVRKEIFNAWEQSWTDNAPIIGKCLNHLAGFRLQLYKHRGWEQILQEPLEHNRMQKETLDMMWRCVEDGKPKLHKYLQRKAKLMQTESLSWHDISAPLGEEGHTFTYDEAVEFIVKQFATFSQDMSQYARLAMSEQWVEAEDRADKRPGAFCTSFPVSKQTRMFLTFAGTADNVVTLAHELGHGYHDYVMRDLPFFARKIPMNLAETASTLAQSIVVKAAITTAETPAEKLSLMAMQCDDAATFFMDIHTRFVFEQNFYKARQSGPLSVQELNEQMIAAQEIGFAGALKEHNPTFWASKLHFYITGEPFYNFPYTFGYLFSAGLYSYFLQEGPTFADKYVHLLRDTGNMEVENLVKHHLGIDLTQENFWREAVTHILADVDTFLELTE